MAAADPQPEPAPKKDAAPAEKPGETVNALFEAAAEQYANRAAMRCVLDATKTYTYAEYAKEARRLAKGLVALLREGAGDAPHETAAPAASVSAGSRPYVAVYMANGPQYLVAFMGAVLAGCVPVHVPREYVPAQVEPVVRQARARLVLVDEWTERHQRLSTVFGARAVFVMCAPVDQKCPAVPLAAVHARGDAVPDGVLASVAAAATPDAPCEVVLSLQEDGTDRLVVLSHRSVVAVARALVALAGANRTDRVLVLAPLSSAAQQSVACFVPLCCGCTVFFPRELAVRHSPSGLVDQLQELRPSLFVAAPRVWEKIALIGEARAAAAHRTGRARRRLLWAQRTGRAGVEAAEAGRHKPRGFGFARRFFFCKARAQLGLDYCKYCAVYGAPLARSAADLFAGLGIVLHSVWGAPEVAGAALATTHLAWAPAAAGAPIGAPTVARARVDPATGELLVAGECVCAGYLGADGAVVRPPRAFTADGAFRAGELARTVTANGHTLFELHGHARNLVYTSGGQALAPVPLERRLRTISGVMEVLVVGDGRKYFAALFLLSAEANWREGVSEYLRRRIDELVNVNLSQPQRIKRFAVLRDKVHQHSAVLKSCLAAPERVKAVDHYAAIIEKIYNPTKGSSSAPDAAAPGSAAPQQQQQQKKASPKPSESSPVSSSVTPSTDKQSESSSSSETSSKAASVHQSQASADTKPAAAPESQPKSESIPDVSSESGASAASDSSPSLSMGESVPPTPLKASDVVRPVAPKVSPLAPAEPSAGDKKSQEASSSSDSESSSESSSSVSSSSSSASASSETSSA